MFERELIFGSNAQNKIMEGLTLLYEAVASTLGPRGKLFLHQPAAGPLRPTKDGVTVCKNIYLGENAQQIGVDVVKDASLRTCEQAGDGTTTSIVLAYHLIKNAYELMSCEDYKVSFHTINKIYKKLSEDIIDTISKATKNINIEDEDLRKVALVATNHDKELSDAIIETFRKAGKDSNISVGYSLTGKNESEVIHGFSLDQGYINKVFINDIRKNRCVLDNPYILLFPDKLSTGKELVKLFTEVIEKERSLLMVVEDAEGEGLNFPVTNLIKGAIKVCMVKIPFAEKELKKELIRDIALVTGAKILDATEGKRMRDIGISHLGEAKQVIIDSNNTLIVGGHCDKDKIEGRINEINDILADDSVSMGMREHYNKIKSMLNGCVGILKVGGATEVELKERFFRAEDAINAVKSGLEQGVSHGGGLTLALNGLYLNKKYIEEIQKICDEINAYHANQVNLGMGLTEISDEENKIKLDSKEEKELFFRKSNHSINERRVGIAFAKALISPFSKILENADYQKEQIDNVLEEIYRRLNEGQIGYELTQEGDIKFNTEDVSIIDPTKVLKCALDNAVSVALLIIQTRTLSVSPLRPDELLESTHRAAKSYHNQALRGM